MKKGISSFKAGSKRQAEQQGQMFGNVLWWLDKDELKELDEIEAEMERGEKFPLG